VAKTTPEQSNHEVHLLTATRFDLISPPKLPQNWGQTNLYFKDYHSDPMVISGTFWLLDITNWGRQQYDTH